MEIGFVNGMLVGSRRDWLGRGWCGRREGCVVVRSGVMGGVRMTGGGGKVLGTKPTPLSELPMRDYIDDEGLITYDDADGKVGVYAIFNEVKEPLYFGKSRDVRNSLRMHLARMPAECYYYKVFHFARPSRNAFDDMIQCWIAELGEAPVGNSDPTIQFRWENAINVREIEHTDEEKHLVANMGPQTEAKVLKNICRRVQAEVEAVLQARNITEKLKFDPKIKAKGLLDVLSNKIDIPDAI